MGTVTTQVAEDVKRIIDRPLSHFVKSLERNGIKGLGFLLKSSGKGLIGLTYITAKPTLNSLKEDFHILTGNLLKSKIEDNLIHHNGLTYKNLSKEGKSLIHIEIANDNEIASLQRQLKKLGISLSIYKYKDNSGYRVFIQADKGEITKEVLKSIYKQTEKREKKREKQRDKLNKMKEKVKEYKEKMKEKVFNKGERDR